MTIFRTAIPAFFSFTLLFSAILFTAGCSESESTQADSRSAETHLSNSRKYIKQGQFRPAMLEVRNAIKKNPSAETIGALADIYNELGQFRAAQSLLEQHAKDFPQLNLPLAKTYVSLGKYFSASEALAKVDKTKADAAEYGLIEAKVTLGQRNPDQGIAKLKQLSTQFPNHADIDIAYFTAIFNTGSPEQSEAALNALVEKYPTNPEVLFTAAKVRFVQKNYPSTEEHLMQALHQSQTSDILTPLRSGILNLLSKTLTQQGRYADALPFEKLLKEANPDLQDIQGRLDSAIAKIQAGDVKGGEELLSKLHQDFPNVDTAEALLGLVSLELGDASKASDLFSNSIDPETAAPRLSAAAAMAELKLDDKKKALDILETALKTNADSLQLQSLYGMTAMGVAGKQTQGAAALEKAISLGSPEIRIYEILAAYYFEVTDNATKGLEILRKAENTFSTTDEQLKIYGNYLKYGHADKAKSYANNLKASQPNNEAGWLMTAATDMQAQNFAQANTQLQKAVAINNNSEKAWYMLGSNALKLNQPENAEQAFRKAAQININNRNYVLGMLKAEQAQNKKWEQIVSSVTSLATNEEHKVRLNGFLAEYAIKAGQFADADKLINTIKNLSASTTEQIAYLETSKLALQSAQMIRGGQADKAIAMLESGLKKHPDSMLVAITLGNYYLSQDDLVKAQELQLKMADMDDAIMALLFDADIMVKSGKTKEAIDKLMATWANQRDPRLATALYKLSLRQKTQLSPEFISEWRAVDPRNHVPILIQAMQAQEGKGGDAEQLYQSVLKLKPDNIAALNNLAWMYQEKGRLKDADVLATRAVELAPESASVLDTAGYIKLKMGDRAAISLLKKAVDLAPGVKEIEEHYEQAKRSL